MLLTCCDSHTATNGALGALAIPIGQSNQLRQVLAAQTLWQKRPQMMRVDAHGTLPMGVTAKDLILAVIPRVGIGGAAGHAIEYTGSAIPALSIEGRMTVCNMSVEAGTRIGIIAADDATFAYLHGRRYSPRGSEWEKAVAYWRNCMQNGILPVVLPAVAMRSLMDEVTAVPGAMITVDLENQTVGGIDGSLHSFAIDATQKKRLLNGLDDASAALRYRVETAAFEKQYRNEMTWLSINRFEAEKK